eukprot:844266-Prymnesium_polylepis.1
MTAGAPPTRPQIAGRGQARSGASGCSLPASAHRAGYALGARVHACGVEEDCGEPRAALAVGARGERLAHPR